MVNEHTIFSYINNLYNIIAISCRNVVLIKNEIISQTIVKLTCSTAQEEDGHCFNLSSFVWVRINSLHSQSISQIYLSIRVGFLSSSNKTMGPPPKRLWAMAQLPPFKTALKTNHLNGHFETHVLRYNEIRGPK